MTLAGAEQTRWWIFHTERFLLNYFKGLFLVERQICICPWQFIPMVFPGMTYRMVGDTGLFSYMCPLWLFREDGNYRDDYFITRTVSRTVVQSYVLSLLFQTQPVGLALHGHVELNWEQTQLPVLQLIRRCFQGGDTGEKLQPQQTVISSQIQIHTPHQLQKCVFYPAQTTFINICVSSVFSSFISLYIVLFFPVNKNDFILLN